MEDSLNERKEIQENEVEALKSIFDQNFKDCRDVDVWQVWRPPEFEILILPENTSQGYSQAYVSVKLSVKFGGDYPDKRPDLNIVEAEGLSESQVDELKTQLEKLSGECEGGEMVYDLCVEASQYLAKFNVRKFQSFAEEREELQRREAVMKEEGQKTLENIKRQSVAAKVAQRKQEIVEEQRRIQEDDKRRQSLSWEDGESKTGPVTSNLRHRRRPVTTSESDQYHEPVSLTLTCRGDKVEVTRGKLLGHNNLNQNTYLGFCSSTGQSLALTRWLIMRNKNSKQSRKVKFEDQDSDLSKLVSTLEQEMNSVSRLSHRNLVRYHGLSVVNTGDAVEVVTAQEFVPGVDMSGYLSGSRRMDLEMIRNMTEDVLHGLSHLHSNNFVHRDIRDTSIFLDNTGSFRLSDYSIDKKLTEIVEERNDLNVEEIFPQSVGRGGKKSDIYRIGILVLSFQLGYIVKDQFPKIHEDVPDNLQDFLRRCLSRDEKSRWSADQLLDHSFIREPIIDLRYVTGLQQENRSKSPALDDDQDDAGTDLHHFQLPPSQGQSRLKQDFDILSWLGRGGFGDVIKVKNKLDEKKYAIKRIRLNPSDKVTNRKIMREVKLLSRLNHENVVRYYNSWQEVTTLAPETGLTETSSSDAVTAAGDSSAVTADSNSCSFVNNSFRAPATPSNLSSVEWSVSVLPNSTEDDDDSDESSDDDQFYGTKQSKTKDFNSSSFIVFDSDSCSKVVAAQDEDVSESDETSKDPSSSVSSGESRVRQFYFMYIQMEFCDKQTLRNCIDNDLFRDTAKVWRMFREIVEGLVHIHTQGMIHRDLKPVNIFIDSKDHVKIGDFGLATAGLINQNNVDEDATNTGDTDHDNIAVEEDLTGQIGTAMYVAPELTVGRVSTYNQKVDLYSLGVIFFEMCYTPLATGMERIKVR